MKQTELILRNSDGEYAVSTDKDELSVREMKALFIAILTMAGYAYEVIKDGFGDQRED